MLYLQNYLTNFLNLSFDWKMRRVAIMVENFTWSDILVLPIATLPHFPTSRKCKKFQFFHLHFPSRNAISSKVFNEFAKTFFWLKDKEGGYCGWEFQLHRYFGFAIATLPLFQHPENVKISIFPFTLSRQNCHILKSI